MSVPREIRAGVPQGPVLSPILYELYINDTQETPGLHTALLADETRMYATVRKEIVFSESCNAASQWSGGVKAGT